MSFWEPTLAATLLTIALFLMGAGLIGVLARWAPTDDTNAGQSAGASMVEE